MGTPQTTTNKLVKDSAQGRKQPAHSKLIRAGAAGAGVAGGSLLVLLANNLPTSNPWKSWLVLFAPSVSIAVSTLYAWSKNHFQRKLISREFHSKMANTRADLAKALDSPHTSEEHKATIRRELENLERLYLQVQLQQLEDLSVEISRPH